MIDIEDIKSAWNGRWLEHFLNRAVEATTVKLETGTGAENSTLCILVVL